MNARRGVSELEWARKIAAAMRWDGDSVVLPIEHTPRHLLKPGNAAHHWMASELGYEEPVAIEGGNLAYEVTLAS